MSNTISKNQENTPTNLRPQPAAYNSWFANLVIQQSQLRQRFIHFYCQLAALPRRMQRRCQRQLSVTLAGVALLLALSQTPAAHAGTITVDGVNCLLSDAITTANTGLDTGLCTGGSAGSDTIDLQTNVLLNYALPSIDSSLTLEGNGHIINGNGLTCLTVEEMGPGANHLLATGPGASEPALLTNDWWHISGNVESGLDVAITLPYAGADTDSRVCKWPGGLGGFGWDCGDGINTIFGANSVTRNSITGFSDWAVGDNVGPTAVSLQEFSPTTKTNSPRFVVGILGSLAAALGLLWFRARRAFYQSSHKNGE